MKAGKLLTLRNALQFQLSYREEDKGAFLRDVPNFKLQYALRKNLLKLDKEADLILESISNIKNEGKRQKAINEAPEIAIELHKINFDEIPNDANIDGSGMWILEHFEEKKPEKKIEIV